MGDAESEGAWSHCLVGVEDGVDPALPVLAHVPPCALSPGGHPIGGISSTFSL